VSEKTELERSAAQIEQLAIEKQIRMNNMRGCVHTNDVTMRSNVARNVARARGFVNTENIPAEDNS